MNRICQVINVIITHNLPKHVFASSGDHILLENTPHDDFLERD